MATISCWSTGLTRWWYPVTRGAPSCWSSRPLPGSADVQQTDARTQSLPLITYDAFHKAEAYFTQPLLVIAGSQAGSRWMSEDLYRRVASTDKSFHLIEGANHMSLYDGEKEIADELGKLGPFLTEKL